MSQKQSLGDYPEVVENLFEFRLQKEKREQFKRIVVRISRGYDNNYVISEEDMDELFDATDAYVLKLSLKQDIKKLLQKVELEANDLQSLKRNITALYTHFFKLKCRDFFKKKRLRTVSLPDSISSTVSDSRTSLRTYLAQRLPNFDVEKFFQGDEDSFYEFGEALRVEAGLSRIQTEYIKFRLLFPDKRKQDFKEYIRDKLQDFDGLEEDLLEFMKDKAISYFTPQNCSKISRKAEEKIRKFLELE